MSEVPLYGVAEEGAGCRSVGEHAFEIFKGRAHCLAAPRHSRRGGWAVGELMGVRGGCRAQKLERRTCIRFFKGRV